MIMKEKQNCREWLKKNKKFFAWIGIPIGVLVLFSFPLFIINRCFIYPTPNPLPTAWSAGELLAYCATFLASLATVFLGIVALWQNHILSENAKKKDRVHFGISDLWHSSNFKYASFRVHNITDNYATLLSIKNPRLFDIRSGDEYPIKLLSPLIQITLAGQNEFETLYDISEAKTSQFRIEYQLEYTDMNETIQSEKQNIHFFIKPISES